MRGGSRPGAGRPRKPSHSVTIRIPLDDYGYFCDCIKNIRENTGRSVNDILSHELLTSVSALSYSIDVAQMKFDL